MKFARNVLFPCLLAAPMLAQTTIGGGACSSATVNGAYAVSITGRQTTTSGAFTNEFQSNGSATFDGLSKVTIALTAATGSTVSSPLNWSGTYTVQANCAGTVTITTGGTGTFNLMIYAGGADFEITGNDSTYAYSGTGNTQPTGCSAATFAGVYAVSGTGYALTSGTVNSAAAASGLMQFDGQSNVTVNLTITQGSSSVSALTGTYSIASNCLGSATLSDSKGGSYTMSFSVYSATKVYSSNFYVTLTQASKLLISGTAHAIYGQPSGAVLVPAFVRAYKVCNSGAPAILDRRAA